jgi:hypothetical protein
VLVALGFSGAGYRCIVATCCLANIGCGFIVNLWFRIGELQGWLVATRWCSDPHSYSESMAAMLHSVRAIHFRRREKRKMKVTS